MKKYDVLIIGGGAAGMAAALSASGNGKKVAIAEASPRVGRKLLATGNGRCNLVNMQDAPYYGEAGFAAEVLKHCGKEEVLSFFHGLGLVTREEDGGRVYPGCGQAAAVLDVLRRALERCQVDIICDARTEKIEKSRDGFRVFAGEQVYTCSKVIVTCGGMAGGKLGHDGAAYALLTRLGHTLKKPMPALVPLLAEKGAVKGLSGLRLPAVLTLCDGDKPVAAAAGEALFTDYGVSGICAMQLSAQVHGLQKPVLKMDFSPMLGLMPCRYERLAVQDGKAAYERMLSFLKKRADLLPKEDLLCGLLPRLLAEKLQGLPVEKMAEKLCAFRVPLTGVRGFEYAQVTRGGIAAAEFDPATLQSKKVPGLYTAGEMLNVDGDCGGYNLLFAFASGMLAGQAAAK